MLLLDTHTWLWAIDGDTRRIGRRARQALTKAEAEDAIRVSAITIFEVMALHTLGRLRLSCPAEQWIRDSLSVAGVRLAELTPTVAIDAGAIPRDALADPIDRLLVATARQLGATLLTSDERILDFASTTRSLRVQNGSV
jgi:PIN domain nuclease of toxin-antitoxin system